jgi:S1-C subfamily serine protease
MSTKSQQIIVLLAIGIVILGGLASSFNGKKQLPSFNSFFEQLNVPQLFDKKTTTMIGTPIQIHEEESVIIDVVDKVSPSVVTVGITQVARTNRQFEINPFDPFSPFRQGPSQEKTQTVEQDIGSGFIVSSDGLIVTNKHVVSDPDATYRFITKDDKTYDVQKIYRDPINDLSILKINPPSGGLKSVEMGDSSKIKVGQLAIAIGTALGEFRSTVTTGVISGVGRGITAGSPFEGSAEELDDVIQTDAAINPGNSGGPLLNSSGQVIGINTAVSSQGQNIGFALPINVVREALDNFNKTGQFNRPFLGVRYKIVTKDVAILNEVPEGAYIMDVVEASPAQKAGLTQGDIVTRIDGTRLTGTNAELSTYISKKKVGDKMTLLVLREGKEQTLTAPLESQGELL